MLNNILVAIPYKIGMNPELLKRMRELAAQITTPMVEIAEYANKPTWSDIPFAPHAAARNALLDARLKPWHEWVMWIDADIVDYPPDIIDQLRSVNYGGITAPMVLIEGSSQFYDTYGFVEHGHHISHIPPYFDGCGRLIDLDAVGSVYLANARVYHSGARYHPTPGQTEHFSVMQQAKSMGMLVRCKADMVVFHADLPRYGEGYHGH
jgi:glycosyltransferase involved in cell wall biosynthesis